MFVITVIIILCSYQLAICTGQCPGGTVTNDQCLQTCGLNECRCNASHTINVTSCVQECTPPRCAGGKMTCKADMNCTQTCNPGNCDMDCDALKHCVQHGPVNGLEKMKCSSKKCVQTCKEGQCKIMHCDGESCHQTCSKGGCTMNCTQSVKFCFQSCMASDDCTMECRAEKCQQHCDGTKKCIILNSRVSCVKGNFLAFVVFALINLHCGWF